MVGALHMFEVTAAPRPGETGPLVLVRECVSEERRGPLRALSVASQGDTTYCVIMEQLA